MSNSLMLRPDGTYSFTLESEVRDVLRSLLKELRDLMVSGDDSVARLFPPAFLDDPARQKDYDELMRNELMASHLDALNVMENTLDEAVLTPDQAIGWMRGLNEMRLVMGSTMGVPDDVNIQMLNPDDPANAPLFLFDGLGWLLEDFLAELEAELPPPYAD
jgi:Domain of unknown function (DUF2017)